ncbi:hypothetical protein D3C81_1135530 [compost metagenome]
MLLPIARIFLMSEDILPRMKRLTKIRLATHSSRVEAKKKRRKFRIDSIPLS